MLPSAQVQHESGSHTIALIAKDLSNPSVQASLKHRPLFAGLCRREADLLCREGLCYEGSPYWSRCHYREHAILSHGIQKGSSETVHQLRCIAANTAAAIKAVSKCEGLAIITMGHQPEHTCIDSDAVALDQLLRKTLCHCQNCSLHGRSSR